MRELPRTSRPGEAAQAGAAHGTHGSTATASVPSSSRTTAQRPARWLWYGLGLVTVAVALIAGACGDETDGAGGAETSGAGERLCQAAAAAISACQGATACDEALIQDCATVVTLLSPPYVDAVTWCLEAGGGPQSCLVDSLGGLAPTPAQQAFGAQFCTECGLGLPDCEPTLFSGEGGYGVAGKVIRPLADPLVETLARECAVGESCTATFLTCAQTVLASQAVPERTAACLLDTLAGNLPADQQSPCGAGSGGAGGEGTGSGGTGTGGSGGDEPTCFHNSDEPDNDHESTAPNLGTIGDCDGDESHVWIELPPGDVDWYSLSGDDGLCIVNPTVDWRPYDGPADVCMYFDCDGLELTCPPGTTADTSPEGRSGCCGEGTFEADINCAGISDDATVYLRVTGALAACQEGLLYFHY